MYTAHISQPSLNDLGGATSHVTPNSFLGLTSTQIVPVDYSPSRKISNTYTNAEFLEIALVASGDGLKSDVNRKVVRH